MQLFLNQKVKIGIALFLAFILVKTMSVGGVFLGNTPRVSPIFISHLNNAPQYIANFPSSVLNKLKDNFRSVPQTGQDTLTDRTNPVINTNETFNEIPRNSTPKKLQESKTRPTSKPDSPYIIPTSVPPVDLEYKPVSRGVYAAEDKESNKTFVKIDKGTKFKVVNKTINGRQIRLMIPEK